MRSIVESLIRMGSFTGKELREVLRRPGVLLSLIVGPFLIMFIFGLGYSGYREPFTTEIVIPEGGSLPRDPEYYADQIGEHTSELQSPCNLVCRLLLEKKKTKQTPICNQ